jgi:tetratricopeptide (TPR) repeat protein
VKRYRGVDEYRQALTATEEAVGLHRELAVAEPARYTPDLAQSLTNLGDSLWGVGEYRQALTATEEAVGLHRELVVAEPARYTPTSPTP